MTEKAPERYTFMDPVEYCDMHGEGGPVIAEPEWAGKAVEYVRKDIHDAALADKDKRIAHLESCIKEWDAERERLRETIRRYAQLFGALPDPSN